MCRTPRVEPGGVWHVDFEYEVNDDGSLRRPSLMAAHCHDTGQTIALWGDDLTSRSIPPFPVTDRTYVVCHYCPAEAACFRLLGWPRPNFIDTLVEFRLSPAYGDQREEDAMRSRFGNLFRGDPRRQGILKLNGMARALGVAPLYDDAEKEELQLLAASGGPFSEDQKQRLINYCISDTLMTRRCLPLLITEPRDWAAAAIRADFVLLTEKTKARGIPVWVSGLQDLIDHRADLRERIIREWDRFHLFYDGSFSNRAFVDLLIEKGWPWPVLAISGRPDLRKETFRDQARLDPVFAEIGRLRDTVAMFKSMSLRIDVDGRLRTDLRPFASKTGRSQPSGSSCLFLLPRFMRKYMISPPGFGIVQGDYSQQEVLVAAVLSGDEALLRTYLDGDCYVGLGKQLGLIPPVGSKKTHPAERNRCKTLLLGILYRMGAEGLSAKLKISSHEGRALHRRLQQTFARYFAWSEAIVATTRASNPLVTPLGWKLHPRYFADSSRTRTNFLVQATAADIMRAACLLADDRGLELIMTVHDSLIIQAPDDEIKQASGVLREVMKEAAVVVLGDAGAAMGVDLEVVRSGQSLTLDPPDEAKYQDLQQWLGEAKRLNPSAT
jgi:hypothetical protein